MNKKLFSKIIIVSVITISSTLVSCQNTSKKITISNDTKNEILVEENEINEAINTGEKYLSEGNFDEAKEYFNKAISLDKTNKDLYLKIKDIYMSLNRFDDAYFIVKTALTNNVDIENMKLVLKDISSKFESINMSLSIYQNTNYTLPNEVKTVISGNSISLPITWDNQVVDSSTVGTFIYEGFNEEYGRKAKMEITVLENVYDKQIGYVKNIYKANGKLYVDVDLVEFYRGKDAVKEAVKDNKAKANENGEYFVFDGYYLRNKYSKITTYEISPDCSFALTPYDLDPYANTSPDQLSTNVTYEVFYKKVSETKNTSDYSLLCWFELKNGSAYSIYRQFTP